MPGYDHLVEQELRLLFQRALDIFSPENIFTWMRRNVNVSSGQNMKSNSISVMQF